MSYPPPPSSPWPPGAPPAPAAAQSRPKRQYSRLTALVFSFFSRSLYRDVARRWRGVGVVYLLLLMFVNWLPVVVAWHLGARMWAEGGAAQRLLGEFPTITIQKGVVSIAEEEPYVWRHPDTGEPILVVDTTAAFDVPEATTAPMLLSRRALEIRDARQTRVYNLQGVESFSLDRQSALDWVQWAANWSWAVALPGAWFVSVVWGILRLLLYGLIGLLFASIFAARLDYLALMRLSAVAMTPGIAIDAVAWMFNVGYLPFCGWHGVIGMVTLTYLAVAVKANVEAGPPPPGTEMYVPGHGAAPGAAGYLYPPAPQGYYPPPNPPYPPR
jgi:hypothetical protein